MNPNQPRNLEDHLAACRTRVAEARANDDVRTLCIALTDLGLAAFRLRKYEEGQPALEEASTLAAGTDDPQFQAQVLSLRAFAYQEIGRYHNAFEVVNEIVELAEAQQDDDMRCAAMTTQARILLESGEPAIALERLKEARQLAETLDNKSHLMRIHAVLGNHKIATAALDEARTHFDMAIMVAEQIGDQRAACGYVINKGAICVWQKEFALAVPIFEHALALAVELDNASAELTSVRYLTESLHKAGDPARIPPLAQRGIVLARQARDRDAVFAFYQTLIVAYYRIGQQTEAHRVLQDAVAYAHKVKDRSKEADMLLNLGESCIVFGLYDQALDAYQRALAVLRELGRATDEAHVVGRLGVVLAELGQTEDAIAHHQQAVALAQERELPALQAEQLVMLALAYVEQQDHAQARDVCQQALTIYIAAGQDEQVSQVQQLLAQIEAGE